ncbi:Biotin biosynthesis cytochrome P450 [Labrenzia sp. THAF82]|uniref:cytochrome P450 n=1 Tax=Labrenzia sp. THAF82 TaxID=2587861 RepID=UPI0012AA563E|nr:cytochrome P450 [Labrenzia sp. THAF82]QFT32217.1 Biotin biosynthesis cytochrome P450 [Labrenzia sp. THAF82]
MTTAERIIKSGSSDKDRGFDPFSSDFRADPYAAYQDWRRKGAVNWGAAPDQMGPGCWYVFGHAEAKTVLADPNFAADPLSAAPEGLPAPPPEYLPLYDMLGRWFIFRDAPFHTRMRQCVAGAFSSNAIQDFKPLIERTAQDLAIAIAAKPRADLMQDLALALPRKIIGHILGLPDKDMPRLVRWSAALLEGLDFCTAETFDATRRNGALTAREMSEYLDGVLEGKHGGTPDGLIAQLSKGALNNPVPRDDLLATLALLVFAGHETTVNLIGNGLQALLTHRDQFARLKDTPGLIGPAIEEFARFNSPSQITFRFTRETTLLGGKVIEQGSPVGVVIGSANHDEAVFDNPGRFDIARAPNPHISFGHGVHACLGVTLARAEVRSAVEALLRHCPDLVLASDQPVWSGSIGLRGLKCLPVETGSAPDSRRR